jgi:hypothetical protein
MKEITIKLTFDKTWEHFKKQNHSDKVWVNTGLAVLTTGVSWEIQPVNEATDLLRELYENGQGNYGTPLEIAKRVESFLDSQNQK